MLKPFLTIVLAVPGLAVAADFWQSKPPAEWTAKEIQRCRTNSPWAKASNQVRSMTFNTTTETKTAGKTKTATKKKSVNAVVDVVQVRWESAAPILAINPDPAFRAAVTKWAAEYYVISLTNVTIPKGFSEADALNNIQLTARLDLGSKEVQANRAEVARSEHGPVFLLLFPRAARVEDLTKTITVRVGLDNTKFHADFAVKAMAFEGKPSL